jgi:hypothetical protein
MRISGAAARGQGSNTDPPASRGGKPTILALLDHVALELAQKCIELMDAAEVGACEPDFPFERGHA